MSAALWPVAGKPVLNRLLANLYDQGIREAVVCAYGDAAGLKEAVRDISAMRLEFLDEPFPVGNAGCIRDAWDGDGNTVFLVLQAAMISPPDVGSLLKMHRENRSHLTVMLGSACRSAESVAGTPELYVCDPEIVGYMPRQGYFDMKEGLIPAMVSAGETVAAKALPRCTCGFRDRRTYLSALGHWLGSGSAFEELASAGFVNRSNDLWLAPDAVLDADVTVHGPVIIMEKARIAAGAVIFGPTIIESDVTVGADTVIDSSALWSGAVVGPNCRITAGVIGRTARVPGGVVVYEDAMLFEGIPRPRFWTGRTARPCAAAVR